MAFLGKVEYSNFKPYQDLSVDFHDVATTIVIAVKEGVIKKVDGGWVLLARVVKMTGVRADDNVLVSVKFSDQKYTRWVSKEQPIECEPSPYEVLFKEWIEGDGKEWLDNKCFKGFFSLNPSFVRLVAKSKSYEEFFKLEETTCTEALPEADIKGGK